MSRGLLLLNGGLLALYVAGAILLWPRVPDRIPMHFGLSGDPTRWVDATPVAWFGLPALALLLALLLFGTVRLAERAPHLWTVPRKQRFLELSPEERAPLTDILEAFIARVCAGTILLFMLGQFFIYTTATRRTPGLPSLYNLFLLLLIGGMVVDGLMLNRRIVRELGD